MTNKIDNKLIYFTSVAVKILLVFCLLIFVAVLIYATYAQPKNLYHQYHLGFYFPTLIFLSAWIHYSFSPMYFEAEITSDRIKIWTINPAKYTGLRFILLVFNKGKIIEFVVDRASFTNYRIGMSKWGHDKKLILQKNINGGLFESIPINIDFLGYKNYTDLIISLDRLSQKMSLN